MKRVWAILLTGLLFSACSKDSTETSETPNGVEPLIDQGTSSFADSNPLNDVLLQGFWWDSYADSKIGTVSFYQFLEREVVLLSNAHIDGVWLPPASEGEGMGYHPRKLYDFNSLHGNENQLKSLLSTLKSREMHGIADLVFNHRVGTSTWTDFTEPSWSCESICVNDEGFTHPEAFGTQPCGAEDEGLGWGGARDLNHQSTEVQYGLKEYLQRLKALGFDSWRYDFVKGFPAKYVGEYNASTPYYMAVGEFWDGSIQEIKKWIDASQETADATATSPSKAFDFALKYKLKEAFVDQNYDRLQEGHSLASIGYGSQSITFLDNHDSGCINRSDCSNLFSRSLNHIKEGYAYLLTHPGIPMIWGYHYFFSDPSGKLQTELNELIAIRKSAGIDASSSVEVLSTVKGSKGYYVASIDNKLLVKIGPGSYSPPEGWALLKSEPEYTLWKK